MSVSNVFNFLYIAKLWWVCVCFFLAYIENVRTFYLICKNSYFFLCSCNKSSTMKSIMYSSRCLSQPIKKKEVTFWECMCFRYTRQARSEHHREVPRVPGGDLHHNSFCIEDRNVWGQTPTQSTLKAIYMEGNWDWLGVGVCAEYCKHWDDLCMCIVMNYLVV